MLHVQNTYACCALLAADQPSTDSSAAVEQLPCSNPAAAAASACSTAGPPASAGGISTSQGAECCSSSTSSKLFTARPTAAASGFGCSAAPFAVHSWWHKPGLLGVAHLCVASGSCTAFCRSTSSWTAPSTGQLDGQQQQQHVVPGPGPAHAAEALQDMVLQLAAAALQLLQGLVLHDDSCLRLLAAGLGDLQLPGIFQLRSLQLAPSGQQQQQQC